RLVSHTRRPLPRPPLFPYTTLFRSMRPVRFGFTPTCVRVSGRSAARHPATRKNAAEEKSAGTATRVPCRVCPPSIAMEGGQTLRSEEHTSELQSLRHLVCRLLLEKK